MLDFAGFAKSPLVSQEVGSGKTKGHPWRGRHGEDDALRDRKGKEEQ